MRLTSLFAAFGLVLIAACRPAPLPAAALPTLTASPPALTSPEPAAPRLTPSATDGNLTVTPTPSPAALPSATFTTMPIVTATEPPTVTATPTPTSAPRLMIPSLDLDREVITVPVRGGTWDLTGLDQNVGWLETTGQKPGEALAMVFVGHITLNSLKPGPFAGLWKLPVDAEIVYRQGAVDYTFGVKYKLSASPDEARRLYVADGQKLLLVTCSEWDYAAFNYSKRLIVVAQATGQRAAP